MISGAENCCCFEVKILIKYLAFLYNLFPEPMAPRSGGVQWKGGSVWSQALGRTLPPVGCASLSQSTPLSLIFLRRGGSGLQLLKGPLKLLSDLNSIKV